jgi:hypothetical protein
MPDSQTQTPEGKRNVETVETPGDSPEAVIQEFRRRVFAIAEESVEYATAPLVHFEMQHGKPIEIRTGVLIEIANQRYLITAAHDMQAHFEQGNVLQIALSRKGLRPVPLIAETWHSTIDPKEDLSVCQLLPGTVEALGSHFKYLRLSQMMSQNHPEHGLGLYLLLGHPNAMVRPDEDGVLRCDSWKYLTKQFHGNVGNIANYDPKLHLILDYERASYNREGETVHPPGLSGCGIYFCGHSITRAVLRDDDLKLVAIQTSWHRGEQYVKGTWIDDVLLILWKYYPDVRSPMRLHGISF